MNELNARLLEYLPDPNTVKGGIGSVVETLQSEAPVLVSEVLRWHLVTSLIAFVVPFTMCLVLIISRKRLINKAVALKESDDFWVGFEVFTAGAVPVMSFICFMVSIFELQWLQIWIAPRLFLLEYISNLIK